MISYIQGGILCSMISVQVDVDVVIAVELGTDRYMRNIIQWKNKVHISIVLRYSASLYKE